MVGGGPAGLATAIRARQKGFQVTVLDRGTPPIDKACGEGLMPDAVQRLDELGVVLDPQRSAAFQGIRYLDADLVAEARFPGGQGLGVRRLDLHQAFLHRAQSLGVQLRFREKALALHDDGVETASGRLTASWVVGADGLTSRLRKWAGLEGRPTKQRRFGVRRHFEVKPWAPFVEVHWGDGCEAYVTPVGPQQVGVAILWSEPAREAQGTGFEKLLSQFPAIRSHLEGVPTLSRDRGCGPLHQRVRAVHRGNLALVGDASGYLDAITGEGLALAFHQSFALVEALEKADLAAYGRRHRKIGQIPNHLTAIVLWLEAHPRIRRRLLRALAEDPELFSRFLGIHARTLRPGQLGLSGIWRLVRGLAVQ